MSSHYVFPSFPNENAVRAFPLSESATRLDLSGTIKLPDSLVVAAAINALPEYTDGIFYISRLICLPEMVALDLSFKPDDDDSRLVCRIQASISTHVENTAYPIIGVGEDSSVTGSLTFGDITQAQAELMGSFDFEPEATPFVGDCLFVSIPALKYIAVFSGTTLLGNFNRILRLRSGRNIRLRYVDSDTIAIDAIDGLNLVAPDACEQLPAVGPPILTINQIAPNEVGNFTLDESDCIEFETIEHGLKIKDTCAASCCGCEELEALIAAQSQVETQLQTLRSQILSVQSNQTGMLVNLIANLP